MSALIEGPWEAQSCFVRTLRGPRGPYGGAGLEVASLLMATGTGEQREATAKAIAALPVLLKTLTEMATLCVCRCGESWTSRDMHEPACVADIGDSARAALKAAGVSP